MWDFVATEKGVYDIFRKDARTFHGDETEPLIDS